METLTIKNLNIQITKDEMQRWLDTEFAPLKIREKRKRLKELDVEIDPDILREDLRNCMRRDFKNHPTLNGTYISDFIVKANNGEIGTIDGALKMYFYWIKKLPEGKDLNIKIE